MWYIHICVYIYTYIYPPEQPKDEAKFKNFYITPLYIKH